MAEALVAAVEMLLFAEAGSSVSKFSFNEGGEAGACIVDFVEAVALGELASEEKYSSASRLSAVGDAAPDKVPPPSRPRRSAAVDTSRNVPLASFPLMSNPSFL